MKLSESEKELLQTVHDIQYQLNFNKELSEQSDEFKLGYMSGIEVVTKWLQGVIYGVHELPEKENKE